MRVTARLGLAAGAAVSLGAVSLQPIFVNLDWVRPVGLVVLLVVAVGMAARRARGLTAYAPLLELAGGLIFITAYFTPGSAFLRVLPTWGSLRELRTMLGEAGYAIRTQVSPAQTLTELLLVATISVALVAITVDILAVTMRRPAVAGLALLVLYAVPTTAIVEGITWWPFVAAAVGYLLLLFVEGRESLLRWGRGAEDAGGAPAFGLLSSQRIGALAIAAGVLLPLLVPVLPSGILQTAGNGVGAGPGVSLNPLAQLAGELTLTQPRDLLRVSTNVADPYYLRVASLETYTDQGWALGNLDDTLDATTSGLPGAARGSTTRRVEADVTVLDHDDRYLPTYYATRQVSIQGNWRYDAISGTVWSGDTTTAGLTYSFVADEPRPSVQELSSAQDLSSDDQTQRRFTQLPRTVRPELANLVRSLTQGADGPFGRALAINDYFTNRANGFIYSLSTKPGTSGDDLADFLINKQGYCEQYAAAMAVMLRFANVPSRVVIGYTRGVLNAGQWTVGTDDAHAWVEAFFDGVGWVPFDPTPLGGGRGIAPPYAPRADSSSQAGTSSAPSTTGAGRSADNPGLLDTAAPGDPGSLANLGNRGILNPRTAVLWVVGLLVVGVLLTPSVARVLTRRRRLRAAAHSGTAAAHAAWDEVLATAADLGGTRLRAETPRAVARRLAREHSFDEAAAEAIRLLATAEERARYAPAEHAMVSGDLRAAAKAVSRAVRRAAGRRQRIRAVLLPPSTLVAMRGRMKRQQLRRPALSQS